MGWNPLGTLSDAWDAAKDVGKSLLGGAKDAAGAGNNDYRAATFDQTPGYDANRFNYGGSPNGANDAAARYRGWADSAQSRWGAQANYGQAAGYDQNANNWAVQSGYSRNAQNDAAGLMMSRAQGLTPSIASMQAQRDMRQAQAAQMAASASARGGAGLALAQQNAANNIANAHGAISGQAQINSAQERMQAEQAAFGAYSGMRQGDQASQGLAMQQAQDQAQRSQYNAGLAQQQRGLNDAMTLGMTGYETGVQGQQLNANVQQQGILGGSAAQQQNINSGANQANANRDFDRVKMVLGGVEGAAQMGATPKAAGGPINAGGMYLVGEQGPELIVPPSDGTVIPAGPTSGLLGMLGGGHPAGASGGGDPAGFSGGTGGNGVSAMGQLQAVNRTLAYDRSHPGGDPMSYGREDGGPVRRGDNVTVGEAGPELVVMAPPAKRDIRSFQRDDTAALGDALRRAAAADRVTNESTAAMRSPQSLMMPALAAGHGLMADLGRVARVGAEYGQRDARGPVRTPADLDSVYVQQRDPTAPTQALGFGAVRPGEQDTPEGYAPSPHPLPPPPAPPVAGAGATTPTAWDHIAATLLALADKREAEAKSRKGDQTPGSALIKEAAKSRKMLSFERDKAPGTALIAQAAR